MTNKGLRIELPLMRLDGAQISTALLDCHFENDFSSCMGIVLGDTGFPDEYVRHMTTDDPGLLKCPVNPREDTPLRTIYILKKVPHPDWINKSFCLVHSESMGACGYHIVEVAPSSILLTSDGVLRGSRQDMTFPYWAFLQLYNNELNIGFILGLDLRPPSLDSEPIARVRNLKKPDNRTLEEFFTDECIKW